MAQANDKVDVWWAGEARYYAATVSAVNADGSLEVVYDDGDRGSNVPVARTRAAREALTVGDLAVDVKGNGGGSSGNRAAASPMPVVEAFAEPSTERKLALTATG